MASSNALPLLIASGWLVWVLVRLRFWLHIFQLEEYENLRLLAWARHRLDRVWDPRGALLCLVLTLAGGLFHGAGAWEIWAWVLAGAGAGGMALLASRDPVRETKKPLVMTARASRLFVAAILLHAFLYILVFLLFSRLTQIQSLHLSVVVSSMAAAVVGQATPLWLVVTNLLLWPVEESLRRLYLHSAARRIRRVRPKIIAVTGSYGKTTTKEIIAHLLAARHRVLKTPQSYNTLMGVCKVIRGELRDDHEFFVVEMGAYRRGSIARLCMLTPPDISVITTIGIQHLERFGSPESVKLAKAEIIQALAPEGLAVLNGDNASCREVEGLTRGRIVRFGLTDREDLAYSATQMRFGPDGVAFTLNARGGESMRVQTRLLGRHNVMNVLAAVSVAHELGLSLEEISRSLLSLEPVPHRLQPIRGAGGVSIIDDAYNANPEGAISALETLAQFAGRKILVTPGLVELGERSTEENRKFGAAAASVCDLVFLVGPEQTKAIQEGLRERAFNPEKLKIFLSTADAVQHLSSVTRSGDVILFENDLPDQYNEASHFVGTGRNDAKA